jgi:hypothetical protein
VGDWVYFHENYDDNKNRWYASNVVNANAYKEATLEFDEDTGTSYYIWY